MTFNKTKEIKGLSKIRIENGKQVRYAITNDSFNDDYGSLQSDFHAWRIVKGKKPELITSGCYYYSQSACEQSITFGNWENCPTCGHRHFVEEK